jgi:hypothetical protein
MFQNTMITIIAIITIQFLINLGLGLTLKEKFVKHYRIISYSFFIGVAFGLPILGFLRLYLLSINTIPDSLSISYNHNIFIFWIINLVAMTTTQVFFNNYLLKRIILRNKNRQKS